MKKVQTLLLGLSLAVAATSGVRASGVNPISDPVSLSPQTIVADLDGLSTSINNGDRLVSAWGVVFSSLDPLLASFEVLEDIPVVVSMPDILIDYAVVNRPLQREDGDENRSRPLIVDFQRPVVRAGFQLVGASDGTSQARLEAFDQLGNSLGTVSHDGLARLRDGGTFFGLESTTEARIAKILIDYGDDTAPETVLKVFLDYQEDAPFVERIPQIGLGSLGDGSHLETLILFSNLSGATATGSVSLNFDPVEGSGGVQTTDFSLDGFASRSMLVSGEGAPVGGYAAIESDQPLTVSTLYRVVDGDGTLLFEAGVGSSPVRYAWTGGVTSDQPGDLNAGLALVNSSSDTAIVRILLRGASLAQPLTTSINLLPGEHRALFLDELFEELSVGVFEGTVQVRSTEPLSAVTLRTRNGRPLSSLPLGGTER